MSALLLRTRVVEKFPSEQVVVVGFVVRLLLVKETVAPDSHVHSVLLDADSITSCVEGRCTPGTRARVSITIALLAAKFVAGTKSTIVLFAPSFIVPDIDATVRSNELSHA